jgi:hypothetical protein
MAGGGKGRLGGQIGGGEGAAESRVEALHLFPCTSANGERSPTASDRKEMIRAHLGC